MIYLEKFHIIDSCLKKHWCAKSERYTGADSLLTAQSRGWHMIDYTVDSSHFCRTQCVTIYIVELMNNHDDTIFMNVIANPYMERLIQQFEKQQAVKV